MGHRAIDHITPEAYLQMEKEAFEKHEYFDGEIYAMAGASLNHNYIVSSLIRKIGAFLEGKECDVFASDLRVTTPLFSSYMYPDVSITCGDIEMQADGFDTQTNPTVVIEVMSSSTREKDLNRKLFRYLQIASLKEIIFIDTLEYAVKIFAKQTDNTFKITETSGLDASIVIESISMHLPLKDIYYKVSLDEVSDN
jgi:Uma2 family endonuclease